MEKQIDKHFIDLWHPKYDEKEHDQPQYESILADVRADIVANRFITIATMEKLYRWKAVRSFGSVCWSNYAIYEKAISLLISCDERDMLKCLDGLPGLRIPTASTILHFIFPDRFPIYDIRTVEALHSFGYLQSCKKSTSHGKYYTFRDIIFSIREKIGGQSLREIDRALFVYHKIYINPRKAKDCQKH